MARALREKLQLSGELVASTPLSVGGMHDDGVSDLTLARDGSGGLYIPGTTLAGCLRAALRLPDKDERAIWGGAGEGDAASLIAVHDAPLLGDATVAVRDGVGIDRVEGRAVSGFKYDRELIAPGARFTFSLEIEIPAGDKAPSVERLTSLLGEIRWLLDGGHLSFGAATTKGLGLLRLEAPKVERLSLDDRERFLSALKNGAWADASDDIPAQAPASAVPWLDITIAWRPLGPVMVKARDQGEAVDALPFVSLVDGELRQTLPGSSTRGSLRSAAERIMRTVLDDRAHREMPEDMLAERSRFASMLVEDPLVALLFGRDRPAQAGEDDPGKGKAKSGRVVAGKSALIVHDTHTQLPVPEALWTTVAVDATDLTEVPPALTRSRDGHAWSQAQAAAHVAVDRWTGTVADSRLFSGFEPWGADFEPIRLRVDGGRLPDDRQLVLAVLALLLLTLRELHEGRLPLGFGSTRGHGDIAVERISFAATTSGGDGVAGALAVLDGLDITSEEDWSRQDIADRLADMVAAWQGHLARARSAAGTSSPEDAR